MFLPPEIVTPEIVTGPLCKFPGMASVEADRVDEWVFMRRELSVLTRVHCDPRQCKTSSVGQSAGLLIPRSSVQFRQKLKNPRIQICMDLSY